MLPSPDNEYFTTAVGMAAIIAGIAAVAKAIHYVISFSKKIDLIWNTSSEIAKQFQKNSGTSLKDVIDRLDTKSEINAKTASEALKMAEMSINLAREALNVAKESLMQGKENGNQIKEAKDDIKLLNNALISRSSS